MRPTRARNCPGSLGLDTERGAAAPRLAQPLRGVFGALAPCWQAPLRPWLASAAFDELASFVDARRAAGHCIYPPQPLAALLATAPEQVRVVILGQDPYHGPGQAHGFAFSVPEGVRPPPSLRNICRELERDIDSGAAAAPPQRLLRWPGQGVLLLNTVLTVEQAQPGSHAGRGWELFTDRLIALLAGAPGPRAFLLWGAQAQSRRAAIDVAAAAGDTRPLVLCANHPSPLSARRPPIPFIGCGHFSQTNRYLQAAGIPPIDW